MNWNIGEGSWKRFKGEVKAQWGKLTNDHLDAIAGKRIELAGKVEEAYGITKDEAEHQIQRFELRNQDERPTHSPRLTQAQRHGRLGRFLERNPFMTSYRHFIAPPVPMSGATAASGFPAIMVAHLHSREHGRQKAALDVWEEEGGSVTKTAVAALIMAPGCDVTAPVADGSGHGCAVHHPTATS